MKDIRVGIVIIIIFITLSIILFGYNNKEDNMEGITAMEGLSLANDVANNTDKNATLIDISSFGQMVENGSFTSWRYSYANLEYYYSEAQDKYFPNDFCTLNIISIHSDGTIQNHTTERGRIHLRFIYEFNIDCDQAYEIAINNESIKTFISENDVKFRGLGLNNITNNLTWQLEWYYTIRGDPSQDMPARIYIDAITGEVRSVIILNHWK